MRHALGFAALLAMALAGVASAQSTDAPRAVAQPQGMALLQATATPTATASTAAVPAVATATPIPGATVTIKDFDFTPSRTDIRVGDTVIWSNSGPSTHTATSASGVWDTGNLKTGESSYFTFTQPGRYAYYCTIHPNMRGTISVSLAATGQSSAMQGSMGAFDNGYMMGTGYSGMNPMGGYGLSNNNYYYNPMTGNYSAAAYPGYPYNLGYGAWWGGQYGYGYPFSYMGGYGYPGFSSSYYPYSYFGGYGGYPYSYYGNYSPYSYYGYGNPYSYYGYGNPYSSYGAYSSPYGYSPYGYASPYSSLYYSYYGYPYQSAYGYYPYQSYGYFSPYYASSYSSLLNYSYLAGIYGYQVPYYGTYYGYPYGGGYGAYSNYPFGLPYYPIY